MPSTADRRARSMLNEDEQRIYDRLKPLFEEERLRMARALAGGPLFGKKEFALRDQVRSLGAKGLGSGRRRAAKRGTNTKVLA
jgi:hypothetical protein